ncbi:MAG TPA: isoprenylcysteine carboxylmethyltransferase family protein [Ktedonobacteraceae bacterium]|nr:isoprenylcysteine carboxylmethyltransferase family protein [Ktedonobacteraceae bacterium]
MRPLIYTNHAYTLLFLSLFLAWCASELLGPGRWHGSGDVQSRDQGSLLTMAISTGLGVVLFFLFPLVVPATTISWGQPLLFFLGAGLIGAGSGLRWYAIRTLGRFFTGSVVIQADQEIVQRGPYTCIRHPSYAGILIVVCGLGLMMTNWASLLAIVLGLLIGLLYRIKIEEEALQQTLPGYGEYMRHSYRLIPFIF